MTQENDLHIHTAPIGSSAPTDGLQLSVTGSLWELHDLNDQIFSRIEEGPAYYGHQYRQVLVNLDDLLRRRWTGTVRSQVLHLLDRTGIKPTATVIPCPMFGRPLWQGNGQVCLTWASADTNDAFADMWEHYLDTHLPSSDQPEMEYATRRVQKVFRMHRLIEQGVRL